jgi:hypothetical protein
VGVLPAVDHRRARELHAIRGAQGGAEFGFLHADVDGLDAHVTLHVMLETDSRTRRRNGIGGCRGAS